MEIGYNNNKVEKFFLDWVKIKREIGQIQTKVLRRRVEHLKAMPNLNSLFKVRSGKPETLQGNHKGEFKLDISANWRLIFKPRYETDDLIKCEEVIIIGICDYHGSKENWKIR